MNENIDLTKILKGCPKGTKLYSPIFGTVTFESIDFSNCYGNPILVSFLGNDGISYYNRFTKGGKLYSDYSNTECTLFPSIGQRDWNKFERFWDKPMVEKIDPDTLQPFDRVLFRLDAGKPWVCGLFSHIITDYFGYKSACTNDGLCVYCIPYNEDTKHLVGKIEEAPEYYRWWKE